MSVLSRSGTYRLKNRKAAVFSVKRSGLAAVDFKPSPTLNPKFGHNFDLTEDSSSQSHFKKKQVRIKSKC